MFISFSIEIRKKTICQDQEAVHISKHHTFQFDLISFFQRVCSECPKLIAISANISWYGFSYLKLLKI